MKQNKNILLAFELPVNRTANQGHMEEIFTMFWSPTNAIMYH